MQPKGHPMMKWFNVVLISILALQWTACSTSRALIDYDKVDPSVKVSPGTINGKNVGVVHGDEGGAIWADCTDKATQSVKVMIAQAKDAGANAVGDVKWDATGNSMPACKKGWGYLIIWPFILTPLFMSTAVTGTAYKVEGGAKHTGLITIPEDPAALDQLARQLAMGAY